MFNTLLATPLTNHPPLDEANALSPARAADTVLHDTIKNGLVCASCVYLCVCVLL